MHDMQQAREDSPAGGSSLPIGIGFAVVAGLLLTILVVAREFAPRGPDHPAVGQTLSSIELKVLTGEGGPLGVDDLRGKVTLINFWGPWCPPCIAELPELVALEHRYKHHDDFQLLLVSCSPDWQPLMPPVLDWHEDVDRLRSSTKRLLERDDHEVATYTDPRGQTRDAFTGVGGWSGYPTTLLLDREGVIRAVWLGNIPGGVDDMEERVRLLLGQ